MLIVSFLQQLYQNFVKNCKFTSITTLPLIVFMQNSLVEIFSYNPTSTYQQGFVYIRQLAIHLRNAMVQKKKVLRPFVWSCVLSYRSLAILGSSGKLKLVCCLHFFVFFFRIPFNLFTTGSLFTVFVYGAEF